MYEMRAFRHRLPHFYPSSSPLFITFRLHGSLPTERHFTRDRLLDRAESGPLYLKTPEIAAMVADAIESSNSQLYTLHSWVVMPNHVHLLFSSLIDPSEIMRKLKGATARRANLILGVQGRPFWQHECSDRVVRDVKEFERVERYIAQNPVKAGLATCAELYRWSSAWMGEDRLKPGDGL